MFCSLRGLAAGGGVLAFRSNADISRPFLPIHGQAGALIRIWHDCSVHAVSSLTRDHIDPDLRSASRRSVFRAPHYLMPTHFKLHKRDTILHVTFTFSLKQGETRTSSGRIWVQLSSLAPRILKESLFHKVAAATEQALSPERLVVLGIKRSRPWHDRVITEPRGGLITTRQSVMYWGQRPFSDLYKLKSLKNLFSMRSQYRSFCRVDKAHKIDIAYTCADRLMKIGLLDISEFANSEHKRKHKHKRKKIYSKSVQHD